MSSVEIIDKNFKVKTQFEKEGLVYYDAEEPIFKIYGVFREGKCFQRMPNDIAESVSEGVKYLSSNSAGGRVRFITDSKTVSISAQMSKIGKMPHFALTGSAGFDLYVKDESGERYHNTFIPPFDITDGYESITYFNDSKKRVITINFPLYSNVNKLYIGLQKDCILEKSPEYSISKPIVYYGSSITQGGCASRPGVAYQSIISRKFDCDFINLGFSGNAKGEPLMTHYIKTLEMSVFVMDYDHNAPSYEHLAKTHEVMFKEIRKTKPNIPIIIRPMNCSHSNDDVQKRYEFILKTYTNAIMQGDKNVYLINGSELYTGGSKEIASVDGCHPNDIGFMMMAQAISSTLKKIFA